MHYIINLTFDNINIIVYNSRGGDHVTISTKIKLAAKYAGISEAELARRFGVTPQNLNNRLKVDRFTTEDLQALARLLGGEFEFAIVFPDGTKI